MAPIKGAVGAKQDIIFVISTTLDMTKKKERSSKDKAQTEVYVTNNCHPECSAPILFALFNVAIKIGAECIEG